MTSWGDDPFAPPPPLPREERYMGVDQTWAAPAPGAGRFSRGLALSRRSFEVLKQEPVLMLFPLIAAVGQLVLTAAYLNGVIGWHHLVDGGQAGYLRLYPIFFPSSFLALWAAAVVTAVTDDRLNGGTASWREGLARANRKIPALLGWALITTTVGVLLRVLEDRLSILGRLLFGALGIAWSLATVFVLPVMILEGDNPRSAVKRSATLFRSRWAEQIVGDGAIGFALFFTSLPFLGLAAIAFAGGTTMGILALVVVLSAYATLAATLGGIFQVVLFRYATTGHVLGGFTVGDMQSAYRPKRRRWI